VPKFEFILPPSGPRFIVAQKSDERGGVAYLHQYDPEHVQYSLSVHRPWAKLYMSRDEAENDVFRIVTKHSLLLGVMRVVPFDPGPLLGRFELTVEHVGATQPRIDVGCFVSNGDHFGFPYSFSVAVDPGENAAALEFLRALGCKIEEGSNMLDTLMLQGKAFKATIARDPKSNVAAVSDFAPL
jgi:hypothetical protein